MSEWREAKAADGKVYYWNVTTKATSWTKPADFDSASSAAPPTPSAWKEATAGDGRKYYYNSVTRETSWTIPDGFGQSKAVAPSGFVAGSENFPARGSLPQKPSFDGGRGGGNPWDSRQETDRSGYRGPMPTKNDEPEYASLEQAEEAFFKMLKRFNITADTPWEDALKQVVRDREYRALKDPRERRDAFDKYCQEVRVQEKVKEQQRKEQVKLDFRKMLTVHDYIKHYTKWKTVRSNFEREMAFKNAADDTERKRMFREYTAELRRKHEEHEREQQVKASAELQNLLHALITDPNVSWTKAEKVIFSSDRFQNDPLLQTLHRLDVISAFDAHVKSLDRTANEIKQKEKKLAFRRERQARDAFRDLLKQHQAEGKITAGMLWSEYRDNVVDDERYRAMLGNPGSDPLELFWDIVEEEEQNFRRKKNVAYDELDRQKYEIKIDTPYEEFISIMRGGKETSRFNATDMKLIFDKSLDKIKHRLKAKEEEGDRKRRRDIDDLRHVIKHLEPPVRLGDKYEDVVPRLEKYEEYQKLDRDEPARKEAFAKHLDRLKHRDEDKRDRDHASHRRRRTPEYDAYEADRRKAQADRERQHRKPSFGLTPPPRDRYENRRSRDYDDHFARERRERDAERERSYISRADPREKSRTLDYGDDEGSSRPGSVRKRRESDGSSLSGKPQFKRRRGPESSQPPEEAPALQSGSEEGEIEEV